MNTSAFNDHPCQNSAGDDLSRHAVLALLAISAAAFGILTVAPPAQDAAPLVRAALDLAMQTQGAPDGTPNLPANQRVL